MYPNVVGYLYCSRNEEYWIFFLKYISYHVFIFLFLLIGLLTQRTKWFLVTLKRFGFSNFVYANSFCISRYQNWEKSSAQEIATQSKIWKLMISDKCFLPWQMRLPLIIMIYFDAPFPCYISLKYNGNIVVGSCNYSEISRPVA